jgi:hypothetical protein
MYDIYLAYIFVNYCIFVISAEQRCIVVHKVFSLVGTFRKVLAKPGESPPALQQNPFLEYGGKSLVRCLHRSVPGEHWWYCGKCESAAGRSNRKAHNVKVTRITSNICIQQIPIS